MREVKTTAEYRLKPGQEWDAGWIRTDRNIRVSVRCEDIGKYVVYSQKYFGFEKKEYRELGYYTCEDCAKAEALNIVYREKEAYCSEHSWK